MTVAFANLSDLKAAVQDWLSEESLDDITLSRAVALAEADMRRELRVLQMEVTTDLVIAAETVTVPTRFLAVRRIYVPGQRPMLYLTPEELIEYAFRQTADRPSRYTLEGREDGLPFFRFSPVPAAAVTARLTFLADMALVEAADFNNVLFDWPDIYLYGTLTHIGAYLGNKERLTDWAAFYANALAGAKAADLRDKIDGSRLVPRSVYRIA